MSLMWHLVPSILWRSFRNERFQTFTFTLMNNDYTNGKPRPGYNQSRIKRIMCTAERGSLLGFRRFHTTSKEPCNSSSFNSEVRSNEDENTWPRWWSSRMPAVDSWCSSVTKICHCDVENHYRGFSNIALVSLCAVDAAGNKIAGRVKMQIVWCVHFESR